LIASPARGGAPFLTDDPVPVDYRHGEIYAFATYDRASDGNDSTMPGLECNYGILPDTQLHVAFPFVRNAPANGPAEWGGGDFQIGVKYRFVDAVESSLQIAIYPLAVLPTGNADKGLGNGKAWFSLPLWLQKSWGAWTTYGGGGYTINSAPGQKNYGFGGWLLQKDISERWMLGGEIFVQGADAEGGRTTTVVNLGGAYHISPDLSLLYSAGHSIGGDTHTIAYLGLLWGFGGGGE
jgi:hypothetical protein